MSPDADPSIRTPWGDFGPAGHERRMARGSGLKEVELDQRERLFGALVASCAERGWAATKIADLVAISGVSSRTFYDLFGDRESLARATLTDLLERAPGLLPPTGPIDEDAMRLAFDRLAAAVAEQPASASFALTSAFGAGPEAVRSLEKRIASIEEAIGERHRAPAPAAKMYRQIVNARLGGILELTRSSLRTGREGELSALGPEIAALMAADRPPPAPLRLGARPRQGVRESLEVADHAERAMRALAVLVSEQPYGTTTVEDVVRTAGMSARTFYEQFSGKEELMACAIESACAQTVAVGSSAFHRNADWPLSLRSAFEATFSFLASRPALATLLTVAIYEAGDRILGSRLHGLSPLLGLIEGRAPGWERLSRTETSLLGGGLLWLTYTQVRRHGPSTLPVLAPMCTYLLLSPLIGPELACAAVNEPGGGRRRR
jgi:AcrR family transcriptional regulator